MEKKERHDRLSAQELKALIEDDLAVLESETEEELERALGGASSLTEGLSGAVTAASKQQIENQVKWLGDQLRNDYNQQATLLEADGNFVAQDNIKEDCKDLQNYLESKDGTLDSAGVMTFVHNWENEINTDSMNGAGQNQASSVGQLNGIGKEISEQWQAQGLQHEPLSQDSTPEGGSVPTESGFVTGGLALHSGAATVLQENAQVQSIEGALLSSDRKEEPNQQLIEHECASLLNVLQTEGHTLTEQGEQSFIQNLDYKIAYSNPGQELPGAQVSQLAESARQYETSDKDLIQRIENSLDSDQAAEHSGMFTDLSSGTIEQEVVSTLIQDSPEGLSAKEIVRQVEASDGIDKALEANSLVSQIEADYKSAESFMNQQLSSKEIEGLVDASLSGHLAGSDQGLTSQQIIQGIENSVGVSLGLDVAAAAAKIENDYKSAANNLSFGETQAQADQIITKALQRDVNNGEINTSNLAAVVKNFENASGIELGAQVGQMAQEIESAYDNAEGFLPKSQQLTAQEIVAEVGGIAAAVKGGQALSGGQEADIVQMVEANVGVTSEEEALGAITGQIKADYYGSPYAAGQSQYVHGPGQAGFSQQVKEAYQRDLAEDPNQTLAQLGTEIIGQVEDQDGISLSLVRNTIIADANSAGLKVAPTFEEISKQLAADGGSPSDGNNLGVMQEVVSQLEGNDGISAALQAQRNIDEYGTANPSGFTKAMDALGDHIVDITNNFTRFVENPQGDVEELAKLLIPLIPGANDVVGLVRDRVERVLQEFVEKDRGHAADYLKDKLTDMVKELVQGALEDAAEDDGDAGGGDEAEPVEGVPIEE